MGIIDRRNTYYLIVVLVLLFTNACTTSTTIERPKSPVQQNLGMIIIAPPLVDYRNVKNNAVMDVPLEDYVRHCRMLTSAIIDELIIKKKKFRKVDDQGNTCSTSVNYSEIYRLSKIPISDRKAHEQRQLSEWIENDDGTHILFTRARFYVGDAGFWNPLTGEIASGNSRLVFDGHLFSRTEGSLVWDSVKQLRISPDSREKFFKMIVRDLLEPL
jgi:hypothetical protein